MSNSIEQKVVEMVFNNKQFESNVKTSMSTLEKLKSSLDLTGASKGLENVEAASKKMDFSILSNAVESVSSKFSALEVMGITAIANLTNSAINAGKRIVSALTIDPIKTGFSEYETQINAVQTILANTSSKGTTLDQVNGALDELNTYADKTIYNFTEMTRNIGTFTAAGIDLDTSVKAIKGIANLAAVSGSTSQQASTAMYQLSQALSSGSVKLQDWNSVVNAGMGGQVFQDALKETARVHGIEIDTIIQQEGSFRESLKEGWLSAEILTDTLEKFTLTTEGLTEAEIKENRERLRSKGYTEDQIDAILKMGDTATNAATKVKTFTQLWDTLKEASQSGWTQSWEIIVGDFEEAKELLTEISDVVGAMIGESADARNKILSDWKALGGRTVLIEAVRNAFQAILDIVKPIKEAFKEIFPPVTGKQLYEITNKFKEFTEKLKLGDDKLGKIKNTFKGLFAFLDIVKQALSALLTPIKSLFGAFGKLSGGLLDATSSFGEWLVKIDESIKKNDTFKNAIQKISDKITDFVSKIKELFDNFPKIDTSGLEDFGSKTAKALNPITLLGKVASKVLGGFLYIIQQLLPIIGSLSKNIGKAFSEIGAAISKVFKNVDIDKMFDIANGGILAAIGVQIVKFIKSLKKNVDNFSGIFDGIKGILSGLQDSVESWKKNKDADTLFKIAGAIAILAASILILSTIDSGSLTKATMAITTMFVELAAFSKTLSSGSKTMKLWEKSSDSTSGLIKIAGAVLILSIAMKKLADLDWNGIAKGLVGLTGIFAIIIAFEKILGNGTQLAKGTTSLISVSIAVSILASAMKNIASLDWNGITKGLVGLAGMFAIIIAFEKILGDNKKLVKGTTSLIAISIAVSILVSAMKKISDLDWTDIAKGLVGLAGIFAIIVAFEKLSKNNKGMISTSVAMIIISSSMLIFAKAMKSISELSWTEIAKGLTGIGASLLAVTIAMKLMPSGIKMVAAGLAMIEIGKAMDMFASVLGKFGQMSWNELIKGLSSMAIVLAELVIAMNLMGAKSLFGATAVLICAGALAILTPILKSLGQLSWTEIAKGLLTIAGVFTVLGIAGYALAPVVGVILGLSAALALIGVAAVAFGAGLLAISIALSAFSVSAEVLVESIIKIITRLLTAIPDILKELANSLGASVGAICECIVAIVKAILLAIDETIPMLVETVLNVVEEILKSLANHIKPIVVSLLDIVVGIIDGLAEGVPEIIRSVIKLFKSVIDAITEALGGFDLKSILSATASLTAFAGMMAILAAIAFEAMIATAVLPIIGSNLSKFIYNAKPFIDEIQKVDPASLNGAKNLAEAVLCLTAASVIDSLTSWFTGGDTFVRFGEQLCEFAPYLKQYYEEIKNVDGKVVESSAIAAKSLTEFATNIPNQGGVLSWLAGDNTLVDFAKGLAEFGPELKKYANSVAGLDSDVVINSIKAAQAISEFATNIPNQGGVLSWLAGDNTLVDFAKGLAEFGPELKNYAESVSGLDSEVVINSVRAAQAIAGFSENIPNQGGIVSWFTGDNTLVDFAKGLADFGVELKNYADSVTGLDADVVINSARAAQAIAEFANNVPNQGGIVSWFTGDNTLSDFAEGLAEFGPKLAEYSDSVKNVNPLIVTASTMAAKSIAELANNLPNQGGIVSWFFGDNTLSDFAEGLVDFGPKLSEYADSVTGLDADVVVNSINAAKVISEFASNLPNKGGIKSWFTGDNTLSDFAEGLADFGPKLAEYSDSVKNVNPLIVTASTMAAKSISEFSANLPDHGGIKSWFTGDNTLSDFAEGLAEFGPKLAEYSKSVIGVDSEVVVNSVNAARAVSELAKNLPNDGGVLSWINGDITLSDFADELVKFGPKLKEYFDSVKDVGSEVVLNSLSTAKALAEFSTNLPSNVELAKSWSTGNALSNFAKEMALFGPSLKEYANSVVDLNSGVVINSIYAARAVAELAGLLPATDGLNKVWNGSGSLSGFAKELSVFGPGLKYYSDSVSGLDSEIVINSANAAKAIAEMAKTLPPTGGITSIWNGDNSLSGFAKELSVFGPSLKLYGESVNGLDSEVVINSANAAKAISEMANTLPTTGGIASIWNGDNSLSGFAKELSVFGPSLKLYGESVNGLDSEVVINSTNAAKVISEMAKTLPPTGGITSIWNGDNSLSGFAKELKVFGPELKAYGDSVSGLNPEVVINSANAAKAISEMTSTLQGVGGLKSWVDGDKSLGSFGKILASFGEKFKNYYENVSKINVIILDKVLTEVDKLISTSGRLASLDFESLDNFGKSLKNFAKNGIDNFTKAFTDAEKDVDNAAEKMVGYFTDGIEDEEEEVEDSCEDIADAGISELRSKHKGFYDAGKNVVQGFADGISAGVKNVSSSSKAVANAAMNAVKKALDIHSPSRKMFELGDYSGMGFINALLKYVPIAYDTGDSLAESIKDGLGDSIKNISNYISDDVDDQLTIRPVLDLTDVQNGTNQLYRMMSNIDGYSINGSFASANRAANSMTNRDNYSDDSELKTLTKAVKDLVKNPSKSFENTFNITGNNPREIAEEVSRIIQRQVERRDASWA